MGAKYFYSDSNYKMVNEKRSKNNDFIPKYQRKVFIETSFRFRIIVKFWNKTYQHSEGILKIKRSSILVKLMPGYSSPVGSMPGIIKEIYLSFMLFSMCSLSSRVQISPPAFFCITLKTTNSLLISVNLLILMRRIVKLVNGAYILLFELFI